MSTTLKKTANCPVEGTIFTQTEESTANQKQREVDTDLLFNIDGIVHKELISPA